MTLLPSNGWGFAGSTTEHPKGQFLGLVEMSETMKNETRDVNSSTST